MISRIYQRFLQLSESYVFIALISVSVGLLWAAQLTSFAAYSTFILQCIFFLSSISISFRDIIHSTKDFKSVALVTFFMLIALPIVVYLIASALVPDLAIPLLLLAAMPAGMTTPLLVGVIGGNVPYSYILTVSTALIAPVTIPFILKILLGESIALPYTQMFLKLFLVMIVPFVAAQLVKRFLPRVVRQSAFVVKPITLTLLGALIAILIAPMAHTILTTDPAHLITTLLILFVFYGLLHLMGYWLIFWQKPKERLTVAVATTYMNFTLAIYIAGNFFNDPSVLLPIVIQILPWALLPILVQKYMKKYITNA